MKTARSLTAPRLAFVFLGLFAVACSGATTADPSQTPGSDTDDSTDELKKSKKDAGTGDAAAKDGGSANACASAGGACVALVPNACGSEPTDPKGHWGDANQFSCGGGLGTGCCLPACPALAPLSPSFCPGGTVKPIIDARGCTTGYDCIPAPVDAGGATPCAAAGGSCVGNAPSSCGTSLFDPKGHWGYGSQFSCGPAIGTACCLPACPELSPPAPGMCDGGTPKPIVDATGCTVGFTCK